MAFQIEETFAVQAPAERVWSYLVDPRQVVRCLPGAELLEELDERTFEGRVKVKIGPVTTAYRGRAEFVEVDAQNRRVGLVGEGQEASGGGSAKMTMSSEVVALPDGGAEVRVRVEIEVAGRIMQFGRGMIEQVSRQLFRQFATCAQAALQQEPEPLPDAAEPVPGGQTPVPGQANPPAVGAQATALPAANAPVNAIQLVLHAIREWIRRLLGRGA